MATTIITGGAKRIGNAIARHLHAQGHNLAIHHRSSATPATELCQALNDIRPDSAITVAADLLDTASIPVLVNEVISVFGGINHLVNNASTFYPTPIELINEELWNDLIGSNLKAAVFMVKHTADHIRQANGSIVNIVDVYAERPLTNHPLYCSAKAGLDMLTKSLARDLAPQVRVNAVAPGAILWPENGNTEIDQAELLRRIPLNKMGEPDDVAQMVSFLICQAHYITGQTIHVDGGRSIYI